MAALLEIAEHLSLSEARPRRTVCFAAFDGEETGLLGAFSFTCRDDFDPARVAAIVNIDMLGRPFLGVMKRTLFAGEAGMGANLRERVVEAGREQGLQVLPVDTGLIGPRGDHAAFGGFLPVDPVATSKPGRNGNTWSPPFAPVHLRCLSRVPHPR